MKLYTRNQVVLACLLSPPLGWAMVAQNLAAVQKIHYTVPLALSVLPLLSLYRPFGFWEAVFLALTATCWPCAYAPALTGPPMWTSLAALALWLLAGPVVALWCEPHFARVRSGPAPSLKGAIGGAILIGGVGYGLFFLLVASVMATVD